MSSSEGHRRAKRRKHLCAACQERKARFRYRGEVRADRDHTLCFECYRGQVSRTRARLMSEADILGRRPCAPALQQLEIRALNERQVAHRRVMLGHLQHEAIEAVRSA
jgi:hypothetical protein